MSPHIRIFGGGGAFPASLEARYRISEANNSSRKSFFTNACFLSGTLCMSHHLGYFKPDGSYIRVRTGKMTYRTRFINSFRIRRAYKASAL